MNHASLYICYFPTDEPLVHTQVLPYLRGVARAGVRMHLLTFEKRNWWRKGELARRRELKRELAARGVNWHALKYHKRPSVAATSFDIVSGAIYSAWLMVRHRIDIVHARAHVPGVIGLALKLAMRAKLIFDLRGLMAEEYVDNGVWSEGSLPFRMAKNAERALLKFSDRIVVLTETLKSALTEPPNVSVPAGKVFVIPCCTDLTQYELGESDAEARSTSLTLVYVGSLMGRYMLREMIAFFKVLQARRSGSRFLILTRANKTEVESAFENQGVDPGSYSIISAESRLVPALISAGDFAISFVKPTHAVIGMSPTKIGEYLAAGLPVVATRGGDVDSVLLSQGAGVVVDGFDAADYQSAADRMLGMLEQGGVSERCREVARTCFSLSDVGAPRYIALYRTLGCFTEAGGDEARDAVDLEIAVDPRSGADASIGQKA
jgi:glycosyltransferase involved in cell wall biosynthesis